MDFSLLTTTAECDAVIAIFEEKKADAEYRKEGSVRSADSILSRKTKRDTDLSSTQAQISSLDTVIGSLPDGDIKDQFVYEKTLEEHKLFRLQNSSAVSLESYYVRELEKENYEAEITKITADITALNAHKATL